MTDENVVEAMARLEGYTTACDMWLDGQGGKVAGNVLPAYLTDHNAVQRVIDGLDDYDCTNVFNDLYQMYNHDPDICERSRLVLKATTAQKCQAILKAFGKWEDE